MSLKETIVYNWPIIKDIIENFTFATKDRVLHILQIPFQSSDMFWLVLPLILTMLFIQFYFSRYEEEELGWNTAFGNSLVLIFVSVTLIRYIYERPELYSVNTETIIIGLLVGLGLLLTIIDYFHALPKEIAFGISSSIPINYLSYVAISIVFSNSTQQKIPIDIITLAAFLVILILFLFLVVIIHSLVPKAKEKLHNESTESS
tara:strand:+ start:731 stop:1342 length:612 start_codon:yes stop_codon:yes gene_type:complete